jgi:thioredoxin-related protein
MKNKTKLTGFLLIILGLLSYLGMSIFRKLERKERITEKISSVQMIPYTAISGEKKEVIETGMPVIIFFFNSECEHCQSEAKLVSKHNQDFKKALVYFFSTEEVSSIQRFSEDYQLEHFEVGRVDYKEVAYPMGVNTFPMCFIYSSEGKLLKQYKGEVKIEAITNYIK